MYETILRIVYIYYGDLEEIEKKVWILYHKFMTIQFEKYISLFLSNSK